MRRRSFVGLALKALILPVAGLEVTPSAPASCLSGWTLDGLKTYVGALSGDPYEQCELSLLFETGTGVPEDDKRAVIRLKRAAHCRDDWAI